MWFVIGFYKRLGKEKEKGRGEGKKNKPAGKTSISPSSGRDLAKYFETIVWKKKGGEEKGEGFRI